MSPSTSILSSSARVRPSAAGVPPRVGCTRSRWLPSALGGLAELAFAQRLASRCAASCTRRSCARAAAPASGPCIAKPAKALPLLERLAGSGGCGAASSLPLARRAPSRAARHSRRRGLGVGRRAQALASSLSSALFSGLQRTCFRPSERMVAICSGEASLKLAAGTDAPTSRCRGERTCRPASRRRRSWLTSHPFLRRALRRVGPCGYIGSRRAELDRRLVARTTQVCRRLQACVSEAPRWTQPSTRHRARRCRSAIDAGGQHDRRGGALHAVECADAVDQAIELADRRRRDDGDQVEGPLTECSMRSSGMRRSAGSMACDLRAPA